MLREEIIKKFSDMNPATEGEWIDYYESISLFLNEMNSRVLEDNNIPIVDDLFVVNKINELAKVRKFMIKIDEDKITYKKDDTEFSLDSKEITRNDLENAINKLGL